MKKFFFALCLIFVFSFVIGANDSTSNIDQSQTDVENIQNTIDNYVPINSEGNFDPSNYKSLAEQRIEKINEYIGPITKTLWGVELSLSWIFIFSFIVWILLAEFIVMPVSEILNFNIWGSLFAALIVATLAMQGFGKDLVAWMNSIATSWEAGAVVLGFSVIIGVAYSIVMKLFGKKIEAWRKQQEEEKEKQREAKLDAAERVAEEEFLKPK